MRLPLADEVLLLGYNNSSGKLIVYGAILDVGLAAALIAELVLAGRVRVVGTGLAVADDRAMGDPALDPVLAGIRRPGDPYTLGQFIRLLHPNARSLVLQRLSHKGVVKLVKGRFSHSPDAIRVQTADELTGLDPWLCLRYFVHASEPAAADVPTATLAALAHVLAVDQRAPQLEIAASRQLIRERIGGAAAVLPPELSTVVKAADLVAKSMVMRWS